MAWHGHGDEPQTPDELWNSEQPVVVSSGPWKSKCVQVNLTQPEVTDVGVNTSYVRVTSIQKHYHFVTSSDRFPVQRCNHPDSLSKYICSQIQLTVVILYITILDILQPYVPAELGLYIRHQALATGQGKT